MRPFLIVDEHSSSTDGRYNLSESIDEELRIGTFSPEYGTYHKPVFNQDLPPVKVNYVDSSKVTLIRASDITANWIYRAVLDRNEWSTELQAVQDSVVLYWHPTQL